MDKQKQEIAKLFHEVNMIIKLGMRKCFEDMGITMPQGFVIGILSKRGEIKISDLSRVIGLTNSTVSGIIDRLEKQNIVERNRSEEDKRVVYVKLTKEYSDIFQHIHKSADEYFVKFLDEGTSDEITKIFDGLSSLKSVATKNSEKILREMM